MSYPSFHDPRSVLVLPTHFSYGLTPWEDLWGWRLTVPKAGLLRAALRHPDLAPEEHDGLRAAIVAELDSRQMAYDQARSYRGRPVCRRGGF